MQKPFHQHRWRAARRIAAVLAQQQPSGVSLVLPQQGWQAAAAAIQNRWQQQFRWWLTALELRGQDVLTSRASRPVSVATITAELAALEDEFPAVELDLQTSTITVTTHDITLDDVPWDRFSWSGTGRGPVGRANCGLSPRHPVGPQAGRTSPMRTCWMRRCAWAKPGNR